MFSLEMFVCAESKYNNMVSTIIFLLKVTPVSPVKLRNLLIP